MIQHDVYFTLKPETTQEEKEAFKEGLKTLLTIDILVEGKLGFLADTEERPVVQKNYDFALYTTFNSIQDHDDYQQDNVHQKFISNFKDLWQEVRVFDSEVFWKNSFSS